MQDRRVAFGLAATMIALKAKAGQLRLSDQLEFALRALVMVHDDQAARDCVVDFLTTCRLDPERAATKLQDFVSTWSGGATDPKRPEEVLAEVSASTDEWSAA